MSRDRPMPPDTPRDQPPDDDTTRPLRPDGSTPPPAVPAPTGTGGSTTGFTLVAVFDQAPTTPAIPDPLIETVIGDTRIVRFIGQGGMGRVYEGHHESLGIAVAVKVMRPSLVATPGMREQFAYEAKVLARLQTDGIARIYAAGVQELAGESIPYFIMEFIPDARTLTRYAADLALPTRDRLDLFRRVCAAVAHGHQNGIVHRDLKPGNILVDTKGQPKVIDFGVAKATDSDLASKMLQPDPNRIMGTFQYMAPEQLAGSADAIDIRCDVYALGIVLYELLTGRLPYAVPNAEIGEARRMLREARRTPLVAFDGSLGRHVDGVAGKCLEQDRDRRYASASALGDDVCRLLDGEPTTAVRATLLEWLGWLARKHRAATAATAGIAVSLVAAVLGISLFAVRAERQRIVATEATVKAERAREEAVDSRRAAEDLVGFMTYDLQVKLRPMSRLDLMEDVLAKIEAYHDDRIDRERRGREAGSAEDMRRRSAFFLSLGELAQATGDLERARAHFEDSLAITHTLAALDPENTGHQGDLAAGHGRLGEIDSDTGDREAAQRHFEASLGILESLSTRDPRNADWQRELAISHGGLGNLAQARGDRERARGHFETFLAIMDALTTQDPANAAWQSDLAVSHSRLGGLALETNDLAGAQAHFDRNLAITTRIAAWDQRNTEWQRDLAVSHGRIGNLALTRGNLALARGDLARAGADLARAREHLEQEFAITRTLAAQDSRNARWQSDLAVSHSRLGDLELATGDRGRARAHLETFLEIMDALTTQDPSNASWQRDRALSHGRLGNLDLQAEDFERAREHFETGRNIMATLTSREPDNAGWRRVLAISHCNLGDLDWKTGDLEQARGHFETCLEIMEALTAQDPANDAWQGDLAVSHGRLGGLALKALDPDRARGHFERFLAIAEGLSARNPRHVQWHVLRVRAYERLGRTAMARDAWAEARDVFVRGIAAAGAMPAASQDVVVEILQRLVQCHRRLGDDVEAEACERWLDTVREAGRRVEPEQAGDDSPS